MKLTELEKLLRTGAFKTVALFGSSPEQVGNLRAKFPMVHFSQEMANVFTEMIVFCGENGDLSAIENASPRVTIVYLQMEF